MIATVAFSTEEGVFQSVLVGNVGVAVMCERAREIFLWARAWFEVVEFVSSVGCGSEEQAEER